MFSGEWECGLNRLFLGGSGINGDLTWSAWGLAQKEDWCVCSWALFPSPGVLSWSWTQHKASLLAAADLSVMVYNPSQQSRQLFMVEVGFSIREVSASSSRISGKDMLHPQAYTLYRRNRVKWISQTERNDQEQSLREMWKGRERLIFLPGSERVYGQTQLKIWLSLLYLLLRHCQNFKGRWGIDCPFCNNWGGGLIAHQHCRDFHSFIYLPNILYQKA